MLALQIAWRFLTSNKPQLILISLGIAVGVSVQIFIGSLITGLQDNLIETTVGSSPHITISAFEKGELVEDESITKTNEIKEITRVLDINGFLENDLKYPILLRGFELETASNIYKFKDRLIEGVMPKENEILIGEKLAKEANLKIGDSYKIITSNLLEKTFKVSGIFDLKVSSLNETWIITDLKTNQELLDTNKISGIELQVNDVFKADVVSKSINTELKVSNWKEANESLLSGLNGQSISSIMIQVFVIVSVVLGISSVLIISVVQKRKQIGILKAMGLRDDIAARIFVFQGFILGVIGSTLGILFGIGLLKMFTTFAVNADNTPVVPITLDYSFILMSFLIGTVSATISALIPSFSSKKLSPMEVIKNG